MLDEAKIYGEFLEKQREQKKIERDVFGRGIFTPSSMSKVERGERYPDKQTRDRLLARLGESGYDYENFLQPDEYADWEERRNILDSLDDLKLEVAAQLLEQYEKKKSTKERVAKQFLLTMRVQWMELKGVPKEERFRVLEQAVKLTIPTIDKTPVAELVLSIQELNLVLEYGAYKWPERLQELCLELLQYLDRNAFDQESKAMLGAKLALYYCNAEDLEREKEPKARLQRLEQALSICTNGIEALRDHQKIYFAWELLQKKGQYISQLLKYNVVFFEKQVEEYQKELEQTREFYQLIDGLYGKYQIPKETNSFTCFYREHEIYCINDVIRARRRMLGISREELEKALLCGKSTLKRLESNTTNVQMEIAQGLFDRFCLSTEMHRAQIVTDSQEALRVEEEFRWEYNQRNYKKAEELLNKLRTLIPMTRRINRQYIFYEEKVLAYDKGEISKEEYLQYAKEALEMTIPLPAAMAEIREERTRNGKVWPPEKYLTNMEVTILKNVANSYGSTEENAYWEVLKEYFGWLEKKCTLAPILGMYGFVMTSVASWLGDMERYEESNAINEKILREVLRTRSLSHAHRNMYGLLWNEGKQKGLPMNAEDPEWRMKLQDLLTIDIYCRDKLRERNVRKKLNM